jgi:hypothetical protein
MYIIFLAIAVSEAGSGFWLLSEGYSDSIYLILSGIFFGGIAIGLMILNNYVIQLLDWVD